MTARPQGWRATVARRARDLAAAIDGGRTVTLLYPPSALSRPRWGHGRPEHPGLVAHLAPFEPDYVALLERVCAYADDLARIPRRPGPPGEPYWLSAFLPGLDAALLYTVLRDGDPARYVEIGSGISTTFVARAKRDGGLRTRITSVDPYPRAEVDALCDDVVRAPFELADMSMFDGLEPGDVVFVDNSHQVFMNSDAVAFLLDVLPTLPHGVRVGIHDILLPSDYLPMWSDWHFNEQYVVAAYLLARTPWLRPFLSGGYVTTRPELLAITDPLFGRPELAEVDRRAFTLWLDVVRE